MKLRRDVELAEANEALRAAALQWLGDEQTNSILGFSKGIKGSVEAKAVVAAALEREGPYGLLGIYRANEPVGYVLLKEASQVRKAVRFLMVLAPEARGKGIAPAALADLADRVLLSARVHRLETEILATNRAAKKWLKHEGFVQESFRKHSWWNDGSPRSTVVLRLLAPDYRRIKRERQKPRKVEEVA